MHGPACERPACTGAHCLPAAFVPAAQQALLAACGSGATAGFCTPDNIMEAGGNVQPTSCTPFAGETASEGQKIMAARAQANEKRLARLGKINPLALEEYAALQERAAFLATQLDDIKATRRDLLLVVDEVDQRVREVFRAAFADTARLKLSIEEARASALPTHVHPVGIEGAQVLAVAIAIAVRGPPLDKHAFYGELLRRELPEGSRAAAKMEEILKAAARAATLTRQLLAFSRKQAVQPTVLDLNDLVKNLEKMLRRLIGEDIALSVLLSTDGAALVRADPGHLEQVVMNLAVNARDAMPQGGQLTIRTTSAQLSGERARAHGGVPTGSYVLLGVSDTGCGMTDEVKRHIFEPFFTTKPPGKGTGLGLFIVRSVVKRHGGRAWAESEGPGRGSTFAIELPVAK